MKRSQSSLSLIEYPQQIGDSAILHLHQRTDPMRPNSENAFRTMYKATLEPGALDVRTKELMAIVAAVSRLCEHCLHHHVPLAMRAGATREEVLEAMDIAVLMGGGPAHAFSKVVLKIWDDAAAK